MEEKFSNAQGSIHPARKLMAAAKKRESNSVKTVGTQNASERLKSVPRRRAGLSAKSSVNRRLIDVSINGARNATRMPLGWTQGEQTMVRTAVTAATARTA